MGRTLTNTMLNLGIQNACDEALYQVIIIIIMCFCAHSLCVYKVPQLGRLSKECHLLVSYLVTADAGMVAAAAGWLNYGLVVQDIAGLTCGRSK